MKDDDKLIKDEILDWVHNFVSRPNEKLNNFSPCPFALEGIDKGKVIFLNNHSKDIRMTQEKIDFAASEIINNKCEVAVIVHVHFRSWSVRDVKEYVLDWRKRYKDKDLYLLKDHPDDEEIVAGLKMNYGKYLIFFVQRSSILLNARKKLSAQGYYDSWSPQEKARVFGSLKLSDDINRK